MSVLKLNEMVIGYGDVPIVQGLSMDVQPKEVVALFGANGVGKSTTLRGISGLADILGGDGTVLGFPIKATRRPERLARAGVVHVPEDRGLFRALTVRENLEVAIASRRSRSALIGEALSAFPELVPLLKRQAGLLSGGEQQMLAIARAVILKPALLMIDEMSLGLAPLIVDRLLSRVREIASATGCSVLLVEQHVELALETVDRGYILAHGKVATSGTAAELREQSGLLQEKYLGGPSGTDAEAPYDRHEAAL